MIVEGGTLYFAARRTASCGLGSTVSTLLAPQTRLP
jgi:hypothetical protein